jgi:fructosamine-3-kinase
MPARSRTSGACWPRRRVRQECGAAVATHRGLLAAVTRPAFVHFDLWDGNVLATVNRDGAHLSGLVDGERYLFGDPLVDLASPALFADVLDPPGHPFLSGYTSVTPLSIDEGVRRRVWLYQLYLYLIMIVEYPSRGMTPDGDPGRWALLGRLVTDLVDRLTGGATDPGQ